MFPNCIDHFGFWSSKKRNKRATNKYRNKKKEKSK